MKKGNSTISSGRISAGTAEAVLGFLVVLVLMLALTQKWSPAAENDATVVFGVM
jgi:hypothetical protein